MKKSKDIAIQLWTVREMLAADFEGTLSRIHAAGFSSVELAPLPAGQDPACLAESLAQKGLDVVSIHGDLPTPENFEVWKRITRECRCRKIIWHGWPRDPRFDSRAGLEELITAFNQAGQLTHDNGLAFGLHNHWWEFEPVDGVSPIRMFHENLSREIFWQLDVYWTQTAGADPAGVIRELGSRLRSIHWKDGPCLPGQPMTALGQGRVDVSGILEVLSPGVDQIIELDECATDPLEAARRGKEYLATLVDV